MSGEQDVYEYNEYDEGVIEAALDAAYDSYEGFGTPSGKVPGGGGGGGQSVTVSGQIQWNGDTHRARGGNRQVRIDNVDMSGVQKALRTARTAQAKADAAAPLKSMTAKGFNAQYRALSKTAKGREALVQSGVTATPRTQRGWATGKSANKANQAAVRSAYDQVRNAPVATARARAERAGESAARVFTRAIERASGGDKIRVRGNVQIHID